MRYTVSTDFIPINETRGTIQNAGNVPVEISDKPEKFTGIILYPTRKYTFSGESLYVRCIEGGGAAVNVVPFIVDAGIVSSGGASSADVDEHFTDDDLHDVLDF